MAARAPLEWRQIANLQTMGIPAAAIGFKGLTMQSDKAICACDGTNITIVDTASGRVKEKMPQRSAENAIVSPNTKLLAVRSKNALQILNLELKRPSQSATLPGTETIAFWTWLTDTMIGIVTATSVYNWSIDGSSSPVKAFDRSASLAGTNIINYAASVDKKWLMVVGIKAGATPGTVDGAMQLYSVDRKGSQNLSSHAGCFTTCKLAGRSDAAIVFSFVDKKPGQAPQLFIMEVGKAPDSPGQALRHKPQPLPLPKESDVAGASNDFPVSIVASEKHDMLYIVTKLGFVYLYDIHTANVVFRCRIAENPVFIAAAHESSNGVLAITAQQGAVMHVQINEANLVPYILGTLNNTELGMKLAARLNLPGADQLYQQRLNDLLTANNVAGAAQLAASAPALRTQDTIRRFQALPTQAGQPPPVLQYFTLLMNSGRLNAQESVELCKPAVAQRRTELITRWLSEDKLTCSEVLGDMLAPIDAALALKVYYASGEAHEKVMNCLLKTQQFDRIIPYAQEKSYTPNWHFVLHSVVTVNPAQALQMALSLYKNASGPLVEIAVVVETFMTNHRLQETTTFLLDVLEGDKEEEGPWQTKVLELNLVNRQQQVADSILAMNMFHHFDRNHIAKICEQTGVFKRALELYEDMEDIKRVLVHTQAIPADFLLTFFGTLSADKCILCLKELLKNSVRQNLQIVVKVATKYSEELTPEALIEMFKAYNSHEGLYYYLGSIVNTSENAEVHYEYIVAAAKCQQYKEVERVCRDSTAYDPERVRDFLIEAHLPDPRALIQVGDRHGFVDAVTAYLWKNNQKDFINVYVQRVRPAMTPTVVGKLLDLDADEEYIKSLLNSVRTICPVEPLVEEVEKRNRLRLLTSFLEQLVNEGNVEPATHNAIGKIYIVLNREPQNFLKTNMYYDSKVLGKFCENLDPYLSYLAYRRSPDHSCDDELIEVTNKNGLFKDQARYLVERKDQELWNKVLPDDNPHRGSLIDEVTGTALPETEDPDAVSATVKAFMSADLPHQLINLLEKLVLQNSDFSDNRNLQNLLILTAIRCSGDEDAEPGKSRAMEYINRLDNFDGVEIAKIALREDYQLFEEAFTIYKKFNDNVAAVDVLLNNIMDLTRAYEYAERVGESEVWSHLAAAQLSSGQVKEAIDSYIRADDPSEYRAVAGAAREAGKFAELVRYLTMCRTKLKERFIDTELVYAMAQTKALSDLEIFITSPNLADIQSIGDRCYDEQAYDAAKLLFNSISNHPRLASCLVHLGSYREAVEAARKANSIRTWKEVNAACVRAGEFKLAQVCGLYIIVSPDDLDDLVVEYERQGHFEELIRLMEQGVGLESAHKGIFTMLGVLYAKYQPEKLKEHIKIFWSRVNMQRLLSACAEGLHWEETAFLYVENKDYDAAVRVMIEHPADAFQQDKFLEIIQKVRNTELHYLAISFYLEQEPMRLSKLLSVLQPQLEPTRVVHQLRRTDNLELIVDYVKAVQKQGDNIAAVNEAVNEICVEEEDYEGLRESVTEHDNFDQMDLAQKIEKNELLEFRRIAAMLYKRNRRWKQSIQLSQADRMFKDAIDTTAESGQADLAEELLRYFVENSDKECFCATLYTCYDLVKPDVAMELAWRNGLIDYVMPYMIQFMHDLHNKVNDIDARTKKGEAKAEEAAAAGAAAAPFMGQQPVMQLADTAYNAGGDGMYNTGMPAGGMGGMAGMPAGSMGMGGMDMTAGGMAGMGGMAGGMDMGAGMGGGMNMGSQPMGGMGGMGGAPGQNW